MMKHLLDLAENLEKQFWKICFKKCTLQMFHLVLGYHTEIQLWVRTVEDVTGRADGPQSSLGET